METIDLFMRTKLVLFLKSRLDNILDSSELVSGKQKSFVEMNSGKDVLT